VWLAKATNHVFFLGSFSSHSHLLPLCCPLILLSHHTCHIILSRFISHLITHHQRWRAPRASSRQNVFPSYSPPIFIYHSPIRISLVTRTGCHPDRPFRPSLPTHTQHSHSQVLRIDFLATHQPTPSFFPFFLRLSASVFSNPVFTVAYYLFL
jgi:hypothetical protein